MLNIKKYIPIIYENISWYEVEWVTSIPDNDWKPPIATIYLLAEGRNLADVAKNRIVSEDVLNPCMYTTYEVDWVVYIPDKIASSKRKLRCASAMLCYRG